MAAHDGQSLNPARQRDLETRRPPAWEDLGQTFETMGKLSLALAVGMSAAALFCRLAEQGNIRVPSLSSLLEPQVRERRTKRPGSS